jgi:hypothetical protein
MSGSADVVVVPGTRFVASEENTTYCPLALIEGESLGPFSNEPSDATEISDVEGVQFAGAPAHVSRTKISPRPLDPPSTRLSAKETNVTYRPLALIEGNSLAPSAADPSAATEINVVEGVQPVGAPVHVSRT